MPCTRSRFWNYNIVYQQRSVRAGGFETGNEAFEDFYYVGVGPVVGALAEEECGGTGCAGGKDGLLGEEVVIEVEYAVSKLGGKGVLACG